MKSILFVLLAAFALPCAAQGDDIVQRAIHDELARTMSTLQLPGEAKPYFVSYQVEDMQQLEVQATSGAIVFSGERGYRVGAVDVRVGDAKLDSSRMAGRQPGTAQLPIEDDYVALRRGLWLATDQAYKQAVEDLAAKRGVLAAHDEPGRQAELTPAPVLHEIVGAASSASWDRAALENRVRDLSKTFNEYRELEQSSVWLSIRHISDRIENSEGTAVQYHVVELTYGAVARARADDGLSVWDYDTIELRDPSQLPTQAELTTRLRSLAQRVIAQRKAVRLTDDYTGPVLFDGDAAANLFGGHFAPQLWPEPRSYSSQGIGPERGTLVHRTGSPVLPREVSVIDDPLRETFDGQALLSSYHIDDEGVAATKKVLIDDGRLKQVLCSRAPVNDHCTSGNNRGSNALGSTLELASKQAKTEAALRGDLNHMASEAELPYALEVERLWSGEALQRLATGSVPTWLGSGGQGEIVLRATLRYPDGHSVPVRNVRLGNVDLRDFRTIVGIGDKPELYTRPFGSNRVSFIVPALLFEELTASDDRSSTVKPPLLKSPLVAK